MPTEGWQQSQKYSRLKPSISTHSKHRTMLGMRLLKCFVLQHSVIKTKHLRSLIRGVVRGFEWVEILGLRHHIKSQPLKLYCFCFVESSMLYFCLCTLLLKLSLFNFLILMIYFNSRVFHNHFYILKIEMISYA